MKILNTEFNLDNFLKKLKTDSPRLLGLDYDGTLAPFKIDPALAVPYPGVREELIKVIENPRNRVVIISGRWIKDVLKLLEFKKRPEIWGSHGLERLKSNGVYQTAPVDNQALRGLVEAGNWFTSANLSLRREQKPACLAVHWRGLNTDNHRKEIAKVTENFQRIAGKSGLLVQEFDGGIELRVPGDNKGDAIRTLISEAKENVIPVYFGDDVTDEDAFQAIKGKGAGILVRKKLRKSLADIWIKPPEELLEFLSIFE
jgi:trehalose 6-phosphate phosphatase